MILIEKRAPFRATKMGTCSWKRRRGINHLYESQGHRKTKEAGFFNTDEYERNRLGVVTGLFIGRRGKD